MWGGGLVLRLRPVGPSGTDRESAATPAGVCPHRDDRLVGGEATAPAGVQLLGSVGRLGRRGVGRSDGAAAPAGVNGRLGRCTGGSESRCNRATCNQDRHSEVERKGGAVRIGISGRGNLRTKKNEKM